MVTPKEPENFERLNSKSTSNDWQSMFYTYSLSCPIADIIAIWTTEKPSEWTKLSTR